MFIQTEATPNPSTFKFMPGRAVSPEAAVEIVTSDEADAKSPLAARIFSIDGVSGVFLGNDFIAVSKSKGEWPQLKPSILGAIMEHFMSGQPVMFDAAGVNQINSSREFSEEDKAIVRQIEELIETRVRPAVASDGGDIVFSDFKDGIVYLHMRGACAGCPSSTMTLKNGIENLLRHFIPQVREVRPVN